VQLQRDPTKRRRIRDFMELKFLILLVVGEINSDSQGPENNQDSETGSIKKHSRKNLSENLQR
jgi:hypothetical protein